MPRKSKELILVGGGHSHSLFLKSFAMNPEPNVRLTLISPEYLTPYSGMIPGYIAGYYKIEDLHIDLNKLCNYAKARFINSGVTELDTNQQKIYIQNHPDIKYDLLSINIGIKSNTSSIKSKENFIPVKPVKYFLSKWDEYLENLLKSNKTSAKIAIIGGGAAGIELAFSMHSRLTNYNIKPEICIFHKSGQVLDSFNSSTRKIINQLLIKKNIILKSSKEVSEVKSKKINSSDTKIVITDQEEQEADIVFCATNASPDSWIAKSALLTDSVGFISIKGTLQSISHNNVFACGDIASIVDSKINKAGVYAVRQSEYLYKNIRNFLNMKNLISYKPQKDFLALIGTGEQTAIASKYFIGLGPYNWIWNLKNWIDKKFMNKFEDLTPSMDKKLPAQMPETFWCNGCGSKLGSNQLSTMVGELNNFQNSFKKEESWISRFNFLNEPKTEILSGLEHATDAAILQFPKNKNVAFSTDQFPPILTDMYTSGIITANHCLNDLYAIGAKPDFALSSFIIKRGNQTQMENDFISISKGIISVLQNEDCRLVGGHTIEGESTIIGLTVGGLVDQGKTVHIKDAQENDVLILTKPIGSGLVMAANMRGKAKSIWVEQCIQNMVQSNRQAWEIFRKLGITACTDISGFGLIGHLIDILKSSRKSAILHFYNIPILEGAISILDTGMKIRSTMHPDNLSSFEFLLQRDFSELPLLYDILFDPQTSGPLLATIPESKLKNCLNELKNAGYSQASAIGNVINGSPVINLEFNKKDS